MVAQWGLPQSGNYQASLVWRGPGPPPHHTQRYSGFAGALGRLCPAAE